MTEAGRCTQGTATATDPAEIAAALKAYFGFDGFREGQGELVSAVLSGRDAVGVMPTGGGKSLCYQLPAMLLPGMTIVISPLISLMADQVRALDAAGIPAAFLNSSLTPEAFGDTLREASEGTYRLLYIAPERLDTDSFRALAGSVDIPMVAVDEAHCISEWGQNFRPSYLKIAGFIGAMPKRPAVAAFTATATPRVRDDIVSALGLADPLVVVSGFNRPGLYLEVRRPEKKQRELLAIAGERRGSSGIVYCATRKTVESVTALLQKHGHAATRYHAGLSDDERRNNQEDFVYNRAAVMVATNAFGMGIDKPDVRYVVHYNMPKSVEAYYQEAGRAGRDGLPADCFLLYSAGDWQTCRFLIGRSAEENDELDESQRRAVLEKDMELLRNMAGYAKAESCLRRYILEYFGERSAAYCGNCGNCRNGFKSEDATTAARAALNCVHEICARGWPYGKTLIADVLRGADSDRVRKARLEDLKTYGALADLPQRRIIDVLDAMEQDGLLAVSGGRYPIVTLGPESDSARSRDFSYTVRLPDRTRKETAESQTEKVVGASYPEDLFESLRRLRRRLADDAGVPAFVIFSDATLVDMCRKRPRDRQGFLDVSGVGQAKCDRYGDVFLGAIREWIASLRSQ